MNTHKVHDCLALPLRYLFALLSKFKNSDAFSVLSPVVAGLFLSGWYIRDNCRYFSLTSISDAPSPRSGMFNDGPKLRPTISRMLGLLSHRFGSYVCSVGWGGDSGGDWFLGLGGSCRGGSGSSFSSLS